jgi:hypothetical protein
MERLSLNVSDDKTLSPKEETIHEVMKCFLASNILDKEGCSISAACARELQDCFYFIPSSVVYRLSQKAKKNGENACLPCKVTDLILTQLDMLIRLRDYGQACLLCNEMSLNGFTFACVEDCWHKLYDEIAKVNSASSYEGNKFKFSAESVFSLWDVLHLQPIGMAGIKALESYVENQIDAIIDRGDKPMVVCM